MSTQNKSKRRTAAYKSVVVSASVVVGLVLASAPAQAASACKGLDNKACGSSTSCLWVNGYERKDGRTVSSFCRAKPAAKSSANLTKPAAKPAAKTKAANSNK